jgi:hypothetical protein
MRPEDLPPADPGDMLATGAAAAAGGTRAAFGLPIDVELAAVDRELAQAGAHARRALYGRTQPTRVFTVDVRDWLLRRFGEPASSGVAGKR